MCLPLKDVACRILHLWKSRELTYLRAIRFRFYLRAPDKFAKPENEKDFCEFASSIPGEPAFHIDSLNEESVGELVHQLKQRYIANHTMVYPDHANAKPNFFISETGVTQVVWEVKEKKKTGRPLQTDKATIVL